MNQSHDTLNELTNLPIFFQPWWLEVVSGNNHWEICTSKNKDNQIEGVLAYCWRPFLFSKLIQMPPLTPYLGVWLNYPDNLEKTTSKLSFEKRVLTNLADKVPDCIYYAQNFMPEIENWLPLYWKGFKQTTRYTFQINNIQQPETVFKNFHSKVRNRIRQFGKSDLEVTESNQPEDIFEISTKVFERQGQKIPYSFDFFQKLDQELVKRNARQILLVKNQKNKAIAGGYFIWDNNKAYYLAGGYDHQACNHSILTSVIWEGIKKMSQKVNTFDFEGSMIPEIEHFFRSFGGELTPYFKVSRTPNKWLEAISILFKK